MEEKWFYEEFIWEEWNEWEKKWHKEEDYGGWNDKGKIPGDNPFQKCQSHVWCTLLYMGKNKLLII